MDIHKPKPFHNLREFASEITVVVCGILIALALDEGLRALHDRETARQAREAVRAEVAQNLAFMDGRLASEGCVERRLDELGDILAASGEGPLIRPTPWVGQPSVWFLTDQLWKAATASGRASLLAQIDQGRLAAAYAIFAQFDAGQNREQQAWAQLRGLETWRGPLGDAGRAHFSEALQTARYEVWETRVAIGLAHQRAADLGVKDPGAQTMDDARYIAIPHAICLPLDTPRDKALAILTHDGSPPWGQPK